MSSKATGGQISHEAAAKIAESLGVRSCHSASTFQLNRRIIKHEAETPFFDHDEDGMCCLRARLTPLRDEESD